MARWVNRDKVRRRLMNLPKAAQEEIKTQFARGAGDIVEAQKRVVAVRSGKLKASITWRWAADGKIAYSQGSGGRASGGSTIAIRISAGNTRVRYAHLVEFGAAPHVAGGIFKGVMHPGAPAQPFFYPTYRARKKAFKARQRRAFRKAIVATRGA